MDSKISIIWLMLVLFAYIVFKVCHIVLAGLMKERDYANSIKDALTHPRSKNKVKLSLIYNHYKRRLYQIE